jgi:hypothetical protein
MGFCIRRLIVEVGIGGLYFKDTCVYLAYGEVVRM